MDEQLWRPAIAALVIGLTLPLWRKFDARMCGRWGALRWRSFISALYLSPFIGLAIFA